MATADQGTVNEGSAKQSTTAAPANRWGDDPLFKPKKRLTSGGLLALLVKVILLGIIDAVAILAVYILIGKGDWIAAGVLVIVVALVNFIYLRPGLLPAQVPDSGTLLPRDLPDLRDRLHGFHRVHQCR